MQPAYMQMYNLKEILNTLKKWPRAVKAVTHNIRGP